MYLLFCEISSTVDRGVEEQCTLVHIIVLRPGQRGSLHCLQYMSAWSTLGADITPSLEKRKEIRMIIQGNGL